MNCRASVDLGAHPAQRQEARPSASRGGSSSGATPTATTASPTRSTPEASLLLHDDGRARVHTTVVLDDPIDSDVIHSWWVPVAGRQGRRRPRLYDIHVVQGAAHRLRSAVNVRSAVRDQPRGHDRVRPKVVTPAAVSRPGCPNPAAATSPRPERSGRVSYAQILTSQGNQLGKLESSMATIDGTRSLRPAGPSGDLAHERRRRPERPRRWVDWVLTTDHKKIGTMYLVLTFVFFGLGGVEALLMRLPAQRARTTRCSPPSTTTSCSRCTGRR